MRLTVGEIKEVTLTSRGGHDSQIVGTSDNQEVVDVSQRPYTAADSNALQRGNAVPTVFLVKGVTGGTARVEFAEKTAGETGAGRLRQAYAVQVKAK